MYETRSITQSRSKRGGNKVDFGTMVHQKPDYRFVTLVNSGDQRRFVEPTMGIRVSAFVEENADDIFVAYIAPCL